MDDEEAALRSFACLMTPCMLGEPADVEVDCCCAVGSLDERTGGEGVGDGLLP